jgi:hypothetical protein
LPCNHAGVQSLFQNGVQVHFERESGLFASWTHASCLIVPHCQSSWLFVPRVDAGCLRAFDASRRHALHTVALFDACLNT